MAFSRKKKKLMEDDEVIVLENICKNYGSNAALNEVNVRIKKGEFVFVVGESGSGKSTFIKLLLRELTPSNGNIYVMNYNLRKLSHRKLPKYRRKLGVVFQDFRLLEDRSVYENVAFAQRIINVPGRQIRKNVPRVLSKVNLAGKYRAKPSRLSGGEQQRVAIARALVNNPSILLCDEPTGNLDGKNAAEIMKLLEEVNNEGTTVIMVTHNQEIVNSMKKRVIELNKGEVVSDQENGVYGE